jgi:hypothetical protein
VSALTVTIRQIAAVYFGSGGQGCCLPSFDLFEIRRIEGATWQVVTLISALYLGLGIRLRCDLASHKLFLASWQRFGLMGSSTARPVVCYPSGHDWGNNLPICFFSRCRLVVGCVAHLMSSKERNQPLAARGKRVLYIFPLGFVWEFVGEQSQGLTGHRC